MLGIIGFGSGSIEILGEDIRKSTAYKKRIGYVPEAGSIYEALTGREYLHYSGALYGLGNDVIAKRTKRLASSFRLTSALD